MVDCNFYQHSIISQFNTNNDKLCMFPQANRQTHTIHPLNRGLCGLVHHVVCMQQNLANFSPSKRNAHYFPVIRNKTTANIHAPTWFLLMLFKPKADYHKT